MIRRFFSAAIAILAVAAAVLTVFTVAAALHSEPRILAEPTDAVTTARALMDAVCSGNDTAASSLLYGSPKLNTDPGSDNPAVTLLWNAYRKSLSFSVSEDCRPTETGAALDVTVEALDTARVLERFGARAQKLLEERAATRSHDELFDKAGKLLPEQAEKLLSDAMLLTLEDEKSTCMQTFPLNLRCVDGKWWVLPEDTLLRVLSGAALQQEVPYV